MAAETPYFENLLLLLLIGAVALYFLYLISRRLYDQYQLWNFISQDENVSDPLELLYCYKAKEVKNSETEGENQ
jgi:hypothetical protein